jgi:nucleoside-diphosphate-sugar epimerase
MTDQVILVTGSAGLIGRALLPRLAAAGTEARRFDLREPAPSDRRDIRDEDALRAAAAGATGIIHLAAVSRVIAGETDPARCWAVNVEATAALLRVAANAPRRPWVLYASSREVYGQQSSLPVPEDAPKQPLNIYARSKLAAELRVAAAAAEGMNSSVVRFSSVYGDTDDHADRVVPAFARGAAAHETLRIDGTDTLFDFTHVADVADGLQRAAAAMAERGCPLPPIHFVSGDPTSLPQLAALAIAAGGGRVRYAPARSFDVHRFLGDPTRAAALLGWRATTALADGVGRLVGDFAALHPRQQSSAAF